MPQCRKCNARYCASGKEETVIRAAYALEKLDPLLCAKCDISRGVHADAEAEAIPEVEDYTPTIADYDF